MSAVLRCLFSAVFHSILLSFVGASTTPFPSIALPLAVRSPYLNAWSLSSQSSVSSGQAWPVSWTTSHILGWYAAVQVDGQTYAILGDAPSTHVANETAVEITATRTSILLKAGPVNVNASFLSPVEPTDLVRQSMPFSYFYMDISSTDGETHAVQVYSDISAEWVSGDLNLVANWTQNTTGDFISLQTQLQSPTPFAEVVGMAQDATAYYSMSKQPGISWQIGQDIVVRGQFNSSGVLQNQADTNFRAVSNDWPVFGISVNLGAIKSTSAPVVWALGLIRDPVVQYTTSTGQTQFRSSYFWSQYSTADEVVDFFLNDFNRSLSAAVALDTKIQEAGAKFSSNYADLLALSLRQVLASTDITLSKESGGGWNMSDVKSFMKTMGNGNGSSRANTVDVLYAAFPTYLYLNPDLGGYLLAPLLEYQESNLDQNPYSVIDLGTYPNATGNSSPHNLGIEESANMLIMTLAHAQAAGDGSLIGEHYTLLQKWADYLVGNAIDPGSQVTADGFTETNQTNLAIKGIIGIGAMAQISKLANNSGDNSKYKTVSSTYIQQWQTLAMSSNKSHLLFDYGSQGSSGMIYNLFADKLLQLNLVEESIYEAQTTFYSDQIGQNNFGLLLDNTTPNKSRTDWMMLTAGSISDSKTRNSLVSRVHNYAAFKQNQTTGPFPTTYDPINALVSGGINSPAQGAMFSFLALNQTIKSVNVTFPSGNTSSSSSTSSLSGSPSSGSSSTSNPSTTTSSTPHNSASSNSAPITTIAGIVAVSLLSFLCA